MSASHYLMTGGVLFAGSFFLFDAIFMIMFIPLHALMSRSLLEMLKEKPRLRNLAAVMVKICCFIRVIPMLLKEILREHFQMKI